MPGFPILSTLFNNKAETHFLPQYQQVYLNTLTTPASPPDSEFQNFKKNITEDDIRAIEAYRGETLLIAAAKNGNLAMVEFLLTPQEDDSPALSSWKRSVELNQESIITKQTALESAATEGHSAIVEYILSNHFKKINFYHKDHQGKTLFHHALDTPPLLEQTLLYLPSAQKDCLNLKDNNGHSPLQSLANSAHPPTSNEQRENHLRSVKLLLKKGADYTIRDDVGDSLLHLAARYAGREAILNNLIEDYPELIRYTNYKGETPLDIAGDQSNAQLQLLAAGGKTHAIHTAVPNTPIFEGLPLADKRRSLGIKLLSLDYTTYEGQKQALDYIGKGADITTIDPISGETILHKVIEAGNIAVFEELLLHTDIGKIINTTANNGKAPFHIALNTSFHAITHQLADDTRVLPSIVDGEGNMPIHYSCDTETLDILFSKGVDINVRSSEGLHPIHTAASSGNREMLEWLKNKGVDLNLQTAASSGNRRMPEWLNKGVDRILQTDNHCQFRPIHLAAKNNQHNVIEYLIEQEVLIDEVITGINKTALGYVASQRKHMKPSDPNYTQKKHALDKTEHLLIRAGADPTASGCEASPICKEARRLVAARQELEKNPPREGSNSDHIKTLCSAMTDKNINSPESRDRINESLTALRTNYADLTREEQKVVRAFFDVITPSIDTSDTELSAGKGDFAKPDPSWVTRTMSTITDSLQEGFSQNR